MTPSRVLILQMGGLGDLVLTGDLVWSLRNAWPEARVMVAGRAPLVRAVQELSPGGAHDALELDFNPYPWAVASPEMVEGLRRALAELGALRPDCLVEASLGPTWFSWVAAAALGVKAVACTQVSAPAGLLPLALKRMGLQGQDFEGPPSTDRTHERQRQQALARYLGAEAPEPPVWTLSPQAEALAEEKRRELGIVKGQYLACFPVGTANVGIKRWPAERYAAALRAFREEFGLPVLLAGSEAEGEELRSLGEKAVFAGRAAELPVLAGLLAGARAWLGNDSGPMHLAQAYGVPGVAVFGGGGHWQAYAPWRRGTLGVVHPLPCFDCEWDCLFGRAVCFESVPVETVGDCLRRVMADGNLAPQWVVAQVYSSEVLRLVGDAARTFREAQKHRAERQVKILELKEIADERLALLDQAARGRS